MVAPTQAYHDEANRNPSPNRGDERRVVSNHRPIDEAKRLVPVIDLADLLCGPGRMRRVGGRWVARCPLPGHDERTGSFTVFPETNSWYCFGACGRGGDVVDLAAAAWGYGQGEMAMAAANVLQEFGHEMPSRLPSWQRRQERQMTVRERIRAARVEVLRRRLFRVCMLPLIKATTPDEDEFREEVSRAWEDFRGVPVEALLGDYDHLGGV